MNFEEALKQKQDRILKSNGTLKESKVYIIPDKSDEGDVFLQLILRSKIKYTDDLCKEYSSNQKFSVWVNIL